MESLKALSKPQLLSMYKQSPPPVQLSIAATEHLGIFSRESIQPVDVLHPKVLPTMIYVQKQKDGPASPVRPSAESKPQLRSPEHAQREPPKSKPQSQPKPKPEAGAGAEVEAEEKPISKPKEAVQKMPVFSFITSYAGLSSTQNTWYYIDQAIDKETMQGPFNAEKMDALWLDDKLPLKTTLIHSLEIAIEHPQTGQQNKKELRREEFVPLSVLFDPAAFKKVHRRPEEKPISVPTPVPAVPAVPAVPPASELREDIKQVPVHKEEKNVEKAKDPQPEKTKEKPKEEHQENSKEKEGQKQKQKQKEEEVEDDDDEFEIAKGKKSKKAEKKKGKQKTPVAPEPMKPMKPLDPPKVQEQPTSSPHKEVKSTATTPAPKVPDASLTASAGASQKLTEAKTASVVPPVQTQAQAQSQKQQQVRAEAGPTKAQTASPAKDSIQQSGAAGAKEDDEGDFEYMPSKGQKKKKKKKGGKQENPARTGEKPVEYYAPLPTTGPAGETPKKKEETKKEVHSPTSGSNPTDASAKTTATESPKQPKKKSKKSKQAPADPSLLGTYFEKPKAAPKEPETWGELPPSAPVVSMQDLIKEEQSKAKKK